MTSIGQKCRDPPFVLDAVRSVHSPRYSRPAKA
jgi:hypothetical protein